MYNNNFFQITEKELFEINGGCDCGCCEPETTSKNPSKNNSKGD